MSKIQEALRRIQSAKPGGVPRPTADREAELQIAKLAARQAQAEGAVPCFSQSAHTLHVDADALRDAGLIPPDEDSNQLAAQYRQIKRPLIRHAFGKRATKVADGNLIMITSALSGEGKTFTSINLALSMARERDHSVILVDADVAKPHISRIFGIAEEPGLLDAIEDAGRSVAELIMPTDIDGLYVLPAGQPRPHATELLASSRMEQIVQELGTITHEPIVIFDSPPLLQTSESSVVASLAGQVVVVVRANHTSHDALRAAMKSLGPDRAVSMVLNQCRDAGQTFQYGYGYSSEKSRYPDEDPGEATEVAEDGRP